MTRTAQRAILSIVVFLLLASGSLADDVYRPSAREAYQPSTYCNWNRTGLPQRFRDICDIQFPEHIPKWVVYESDVGAKLKIDINSIHHFGPASGLSGYAAITTYDVGDGRFDVFRYHTLLFDCRGNYKEWTSPGQMSFAPPRSVMGAVSAYACTHTSVKSEDYCKGFDPKMCRFIADHVEDGTWPGWCQTLSRSEQSAAQARVCDTILQKNRNSSLDRAYRNDEDDDEPKGD